MTWTAEKQEVVRSMWLAGVPAATIAAAVGMTRNAVIGKAHRMNLGSHVFAQLKSWSSARKKLKRAKLRLVEPVVELKEIPIGQRRRLLELTACNCRWPVGDPRNDDFFFCGGNVQEGESYCPYHYHVAHDYRPERIAA